MVSLDVETGQSLHLSCGLEPLHVSKVTTAGLGAANDEDRVPVINQTDISGGDISPLLNIYIYYILLHTSCPRESWDKLILIYIVYYKFYSMSGKNGILV